MPGKVLFALLYCQMLGFAGGSPTAEVLLSDLGCSVCHSGIPGESTIAEKAPDLSAAGIRYHPEYLFNYLQHPVRVRQDIGLSRMPNFYLGEKEALALTLYLQELAPPQAERPDFPLSKAYQQVRAAYPEITAQTGEKIFRSLNCAACHRQSAAVGWEGKMAPDLSFEGMRAKEEWLTAYLKKPRPLRPFGYYPGSGARMPDFMLSDGEVQTLAAYLRQQKGNFPPDSVAFQSQKLSAHNREKAYKLLKDKLPCLGCHQLGGEGGRIGPDLSSLKHRLQEDYVYRIIKNPRRLIPEGIMPQIAMPQAQLDLIVSYLLQQELPRTGQPYLSLTDNEPFFYQGPEKNRGLYVKYCAACHGPEGNGDGYNAQFLPAAPTKHSEAAYMSTRPDDTLFDGIYAGGYILNKSRLMPSWGFTLAYEDIRGLVAYLRQLCRCQGPEWSRDNH